MNMNVGLKFKQIHQSRTIDWVFLLRKSRTLRRALLVLTLMVGWMVRGQAQWANVGPYGGLVRETLKVKDTLITATDFGGIYLSADQGKNWFKTGFHFAPNSIYSITADDRYIYVASDNQIWVSSDLGRTWLYQFPIPSLAADPNLTGTKMLVAENGYMITANDLGIWFSTNFGQKWRPIYLPFALSNTIGFAFRHKGYFYLTYVPYSTSGDFTINTIRTKIGVNISFEKVNQIPLLTWSEYHVQFDGDEQFILANNQIYRFTNDGFTKDSDAYTVPFGLMNCVFNGKDSVLLFSGQFMNQRTMFDNGSCSTHDEGHSWTSLNLAYYFSDYNFLDQTILAVEGIKYDTYNTQDFTYKSDGGGIYQSYNKGVSWELSNHGFTNVTVNNLYNYGNKILAFTPYLTQGGVPSPLTESNDKGKTWSRNQSFKFTVSSITSNNFYFFVCSGEMGMYRSRIGSEDWVKIDTAINLYRFVNQVMDGESSVFYRANNFTQMQNWQINNHDFLMMEIDKFCVYAYVDGNKLMRSLDYAKSWIEIAPEISRFNVTALAANDYSLFVSTRNGVFKSNDHGNHWEVIPNDFFANEIIANFVVYGNYMLALSDTSVYLSRDYGLTWKDFTDSLPDHVTSILFKDDKVIVGTQSTGIWMNDRATLFGEPKNIPQFELQFTLAPNPGLDKITLLSNQAVDHSISIELFDMAGRKLYDENGSFIDNKEVIDIGWLADGEYFFNIQNEDKAYKIRFIKCFCP